jgi:hypothetical protein
VIGLRKLGRGQREDGLAALAGCTDTGVFDYVQYRFAQVFLARAAADTDWPHWLSAVTPTHDSSTSNP